VVLLKKNSIVHVRPINRACVRTAGYLLPAATTGLFSYVCPAAVLPGGKNVDIRPQIKDILPLARLLRLVIGYLAVVL
jgi:hypothetical protein